MSKPKSNAKLLNLPEEQQAKLADWLLGGMPYHEARVLTQKEFGVSASNSTFSDFFQQVCAPHLLARRRDLGSTAQARATEAKLNPGEFDAATMDALRQKAYELAEAPNANPKDVRAVMTLLLKAQDQEFKRDRLALDRDKYEMMVSEKLLDDALSAKADEINASNLSNADKIAAMRREAFKSVDDLQKSGSVKIPKS